jgi:hypothetical protein
MNKSRLKQDGLKGLISTISGTVRVNIIQSIQKNISQESVFGIENTKYNHQSYEK